MPIICLSLNSNNISSFEAQKKGFNFKGKISCSFRFRTIGNKTPFQNY